MEEVNKPLTLGSLFDGSGGFPLGGLRCGIIPKWASEIEPFPIRVTTKRLPDVKHLGDISVISGTDIEPVDVITFGSPCTDTSISGKRAGLNGSQSVLFYQAVRIIKEMRCATNGKYPRFIVWENVPGTFSSNKGEDFRAVLEEICKIKSEVYAVPKPPSGKWDNAGNIVADCFSLAWRVFDAQYWGVPQRRKRIYLVADFTGGSASKILFESEGVSGYSAESFSARQRNACHIEGCIGETSLDCLNNQSGNRAYMTEDALCYHFPLMFENHSQDTRYTGPLEIAQTVSSSFVNGGNNQPFILEIPAARDYKPPFIENHACEVPEYIVRRLTPTECARLQGFPDWWCRDLGTEEPTAADVAFWSEVFETHRKIIGTSTKPKTEKQIIKWLKNPHSDAAEYKMWGGGVALPCVCFVLSGIMCYSRLE